MKTDLVKKFTEYGKRILVIEKTAIDDLQGTLDSLARYHESLSTLFLAEVNKKLAERENRLAAWSVLLAIIAVVIAILAIYYSLTGFQLGA